MPLNAESASSMSTKKLVTGEGASCATPCRRTSNSCASSAARVEREFLEAIIFRMMLLRILI
jgi:hypothetical protein